MHTFDLQVTLSPSMTALTGWTIHYSRSDSSSNVTTDLYNANINSIVLTGLDEGTSYTISVAANNNAGMGSFTNEMISTLINCK